MISLEQHINESKDKELKFIISSFKNGKDSIMSMIAKRIENYDKNDRKRARDIMFLTNETFTSIAWSSVDILNTEIFEKMDSLFDKDVDSAIKKRIITDVTKYINNNYLKQLLENIDFKILVKDTILTNSIKEQGERYLFTLENSRLFDVQ